MYLKKKRTMEMTHKNYKSDFDAILHLKSCVDDVCKDVGWPDYDWVARFYTTSHDNVYIASNIGGVLTNCFNDNGNIHVVFNNHGLGSGTLRVEFSAEIPNEIYPDGSQLEVSPQSLNIELVRGVGDCGTIADVEVMLSFIKGEKGDKGDKGDRGERGPEGPQGPQGERGEAFTYEDFTPEQIEELQRPATAAAESISALEANISAEEHQRKLNETSRARAEYERMHSELERVANETARQTAEATRQSNELERIEAESDRVSAETARAEEFATWENEIDSKADRSELSNVIAEEPLTPENFPDIGTYTREELKKDLFVDMWNSACGRHGKYNAETGYFELNGLTDLTYEQALKIFNQQVQTPAEYASKYHNTKGIPTCLCIYSPQYWEEISLYQFAAFNTDIKVINLSLNTNEIHAADMRNTFRGCISLTKVTSIIYDGGNTSWIGTFADATILEDIQIHNLKHSIDIRSTPVISLSSLQYLVTNATNTSAINITVHSDVFAKLTDESNTEWYQVLLDAAAKNINFATV